MNAILHGANLHPPKKQTQQLIIELGKSISNPQRQMLTDIYLALDTANTLLSELHHAHRIIRHCIRHLDEDQLSQIAKFGQADGLTNFFMFRTQQRNALLEMAQRRLGTYHA